MSEHTSTKHLWDNPRCYTDCFYAFPHIHSIDCIRYNAYLDEWSKNSSLHFTLKNNYLLRISTKKWLTFSDCVYSTACGIIIISIKNRVKERKSHPRHAVLIIDCTVFFIIISGFIFRLLFVSSDDDAAANWVIEMVSFPRANYYSYICIECLSLLNKRLNRLRFRHHQTEKWMRSNVVMMRRETLTIYGENSIEEERRRSSSEKRIRWIKMFIYIHQGRFSSTGNACIASNLLFIFY